jgi:voltage-gated potassium channel Kch
MSVGPEEANDSRRALWAVRSQIRPGSFPLLLAANVSLYLLNGLAIDTPAGATLVLLARAAVVGASIYVLSTSRVTMWLGTIIVGLVITFTLGWWTLGPQMNRTVQDAITTAFLLWVLVVVLREVFRPGTAERDAVIGALCGFLLILAVFMRMHGLIEALVPGSYHAEGPPLSERADAFVSATFQYFSTVTLTTVGFGDIVPITPVARLATGLEAIVGQLYLAVVIATLVGRVVSRQG